MKVTIEKVERLRECADVGYETAREALEAADGDLLEAVIALEKDGKFGPNAGRGRSASYSTGEAPPAAAVGQVYGAGTMPLTRTNPNFTIGSDTTMSGGRGKEQKKAEKAGRKERRRYEYAEGQPDDWQSGANGRQRGPHRYSDETTPIEDNFRRFADWLGRVIRASFTNYFEVWRNGERLFYFPVFLFVFCLIYWVFWIALVALVIGLFCGCRYHFSGPHLGKKSVNDKMDEVSDMAEEFKHGQDPHN